MSQYGMAVPAASGYPQFSGNLIHPMMSQKLIDHFYCTSIFGEVSTTEYQGEFSRGGDQVTFMKPTGGVIIRDYVKNGKMKHDVPEAKPITMVINRAKYASFKIDCVDEMQMQVWDALKARQLEDTSRAMSDCIDEEILCTIPTEVAPTNQGTAAGCQCKMVDLGEFGAPVKLNAATILAKLVDLSLVLDEQCVPAEGRFVVLPHCFKPLIFNGPLSCVDCSGMDQSMYLNGRLPAELVGFTIYFSHNIKAVDDPSNCKAWNIIAGLKMATAFASQIEKVREFEGHDSFDTYYQMLQVYGFKVMHPEALVHLYAGIEE
jgi:hypothetical protein